MSIGIFNSEDQSLVKLASNSITADETIETLNDIKVSVATDKASVAADKATVSADKADIVSMKSEIANTKTTIDETAQTISENANSVQQEKIAIDETKTDIDKKYTEISNTASKLNTEYNNLTSNYYTKEATNSLISSTTKLKYSVVNELPTSDISTDIIYLKSTNTTSTDGIYEMYTYQDSNWVKIGTSNPDLADYYTKELADSTFATKTEINNTNTEVSELKEDIGTLKKDVYGITNFSVIKNEYVTANGEIKPYNGWNRSDKISCVGFYEISFERKDGYIGGGYNCFFDANDNFISQFTTRNNSVDVPVNASYFIISAEAINLPKIVVYAEKDALSIKLNNAVTEIEKRERIENIIVTNPYYFRRVTGNRIERYKPTESGAFLKFDKITFDIVGKKITKTWADFKADVTGKPYANFHDSYDGVKDCLELYKEYYVVFDYATEKFDHYNKVYGGMKKNSVLLLYCDESNNPNGIIYDLYKKTIPLSPYMDTIKAKEIDVLGTKSDFTFTFATDVHWYFDDTAYRNVTNNMLAEIAKAVSVDCYINGGDSIYYGTKFKANGVSCMEQVNELIDTDNMVYCVGNHDYNGISTGETNNIEWNFNRTDYENLMMRRLKDIHRPSGKFYYYRDFTDKKVRVISLDTSDTGFTFGTNGNITNDPLTQFNISQEQLDWLKTDALNVDDSWNIVVVMHVGAYTESDGFIDNNPLTNSNLLIAMLKAYNNKSGDFANYKGNLVCVLSGHAHADGYCNKDGFNAIQVNCSYPSKSNREPNTIDEVAVDCVTIDSEARKVKLFRFGNGNDREYSF